jgi:putative transcriptional regulator
MISYDVFWETLRRKGITQYALIHKYNLSAGYISRIKAGKNINTNTIDMLCNILDCEVQDIIRHVKDDNAM